MSSTKARMLIQRYGVSGSYTSGKMKSEKCPLCKTEEETLSHMLVRCEELEAVRNDWLRKLEEILEPYINTHNGSHLMQAILDSSTFHWIPHEVQTTLEKISRRLCYYLHMERSHRLVTPTSALQASEPSNMDNMDFTCIHTGMTSGSPV
jgi:hypothetical protein